MGILDDIQAGRPINLNKRHDQESTYDRINSEIEKLEEYDISDILDFNQEEPLEKPPKISQPPTLGAVTRPPPIKEEPSLSPPRFPATAPLEYLMSEREEKQRMEDGVWQLKITISLLSIDELIKSKDFSNNVAYQNHRSRIIKKTPPDNYPGFKVELNIGSLTSGKRIVMPCYSKEQVMHSKEFILAVREILSVIAMKSGHKSY